MLKEKRVFDAAQRGEILLVDRYCEICANEEKTFGGKEKAKYMLPTREFSCLECAHKYLLKKENEDAKKNRRE